LDPTWTQSVLKSFRRARTLILRQSSQPRLRPICGFVWHKCAEASPDRHQCELRLCERAHRDRATSSSEFPVNRAAEIRQTRSSRHARASRFQPNGSFVFATGRSSISASSIVMVRTPRAVLGDLIRRPYFFVGSIARTIDSVLNSKFRSAH
jgi:hypothetical protein